MYTVYLWKSFLFQVIQFSQTDLFQTIQFSMSTQVKYQPVLFQVIQFNISMQFSFIWTIHRTLPGATTPGQGVPGSDGNERVL